MMSRSDSTVDASIVEGSPSPTTPSSNNDLSSANVDGQIQSPNVSSDPTLSLARNPSEGSPPPPRRSSRVADGIKQPARYNVSPPLVEPKRQQRPLGSPKASTQYSRASRSDSAADSHPSDLSSQQTETFSQERARQIADILISAPSWDPVDLPSQCTSSPPTDKTIRHECTQKVPLADTIIELLDEASPSFQERIQSFTVYPHPTAPTFSREVLLQFAHCMELLIKLLSQTRRANLSVDEEWRIRMLLFSLPRLLLRVRPSACAPERNRKAMAACKAFINGNLFPSKGSPGLFKQFEIDHARPRKRRSTDAQVDEPPSNVLQPTAARLHRTQCLVRAGNYGGAVQTLTSPGHSSLSASDSHQLLVDLHPTQPLPVIPPILSGPLNPDQCEALLDDWDTAAVRRAINRSSNRSSSDQFGWRARETLGRIFTLRPELCTPWLEHVCLPLIQNSAPQWAASILSGGLLIPLGKGNKPGIRPIGIGDLARKIIARLLIHSNREAIGKFFVSEYQDNYSQLGVAVPGGAEKLVNLVSLARDLSLSGSQDLHSSRPRLPFKSDFVIIACDNKNGFNLASRQLAFDCLAGTASRDYSSLIKQGDSLPKPQGLKHAEALVSLLTTLYGNTSTYNFLGDDGQTYAVPSTAGFHQGCVLSSFMFSLTVFPLLGKLLETSPGSLGASFLDNHFLMGPLDKVWPVIAPLTRTFSDLGMHLNPVDNFINIPSWHGLDPAVYQPILDGLEQESPGVLTTGDGEPGFTVTTDGMKVLGVPVGTDSFIQPILDKRVDDLTNKLHPLGYLPDGRIWASLLRTCYALMPAYHLRTIPTATLERLGYLEKIQNLFSAHIAFYLSWPADWHGRMDPRDVEPATPSFMYRNALRQLQNPLPLGGLGLGSIHTITISAFFSAASTSLHWIYDSRRQLRLHPLLHSLPQCANDTLADFTSQSSLLCGWNDSREFMLRLRHPPENAKPNEKPRFIISDAAATPNHTSSAQTIILPSLLHLLWSSSNSGSVTALKEGEPPPSQRVLTKALCTFSHLADVSPLTAQQASQLAYAGKTEVSHPNPHHHMSAAGPPDAAQNVSSRQNAHRIRHCSIRHAPFQASFADKDQTVFPHAPAPNRSGNVAKKRDDSGISSFPLSFLGVVPTHSLRDAFPRDFFITFLNMFLGLPRPLLLTYGGVQSVGSPGTTCLCATTFDDRGLHALTCKRWYKQTATEGHHQILDSIHELLGEYGIPITIQDSQLPRHDGTIGTTGKRGDIYIQREFHSSAGLHFQRGVVADLSLTSDLIGEGSWGNWLPTHDSPSVRNRFRAKFRKHSPPYTSKGFFFVPLIASTYGQLHPDFLRFLWHYSRVPSDHPLLYELYTTGEVRHGYSQGDDLLTCIQKALFFRLKARITSLIARTTASRILGYSCSLEVKHRFRSFPSDHHEYNPYFLLAPPAHLNPLSSHMLAPAQVGAGD